MIDKQDTFDGWLRAATNYVRAIQARSYRRLSSESAEDVAQATLMYFQRISNNFTSLPQGGGVGWRRLPGPDGEMFVPPVKHFAFVARHRFIDSIRRHGRPGKIPDIRPGYNSPINTSPLDVLLSEELREALASCIEKLSDQARRYVHLKFFDALTYDAIAERDETTFESVRSVIRKAKKLLLNCLVRNGYGLDGGAA